MPSKIVQDIAMARERQLMDSYKNNFTVTKMRIPSGIVIGMGQVPGLPSMKQNPFAL